MSSEPTGSSTVYDILGWVEVNKKRLVVGALVATALGFSMATYRHFAREKEVAASSALMQVRGLGSARMSTNAPSAAEFLRVGAQYGGTAAAERAALLAAGAYFGEQKYEEARQQFEQALKAKPDSPWAAEAAFGLAVSLDALDRVNEAVAGYQDVLTRHSGSPVAAQAQLGLGRLYEAQGKPEQALKMYEELSKGGAFNVWAGEAAGRKQQLLGKFPQLAKPATPVGSTNAVVGGTNAPAPAPASVPAGGGQ